MLDKKNFDIIIEPNHINKQYWKDLWNYRELFYFLAWKDILVRYKQTVIGVTWSILRPFLTMIVFTIVFGKVAKLSTGTVPYAIVVFSALLPWQFFSNAFSESSNSLISNSNLLTKVYFPRIIVPTSSVIVGLVDFFISFILLILIMIFYKYAPSINIIVLPVFLIMAFMVSQGAGLCVASLNVKYRDFRFVVPFVIQLGLYISPVGFSSNVVPIKWRLLYSLNPMVGIIDGFRWCILGEKLYIPGLLLSLAITISVFIFGIWYFRKFEKTFADII